MREFAERIRSVGFRCTGCCDCCRSESGESNIVIVSPPEIRDIMESTGLLWDDVVEPYPEFISEKGACYTFAWCLRRRDGDCIFLKDGRCSIYAHRPWICRTYPFMLDGDELLVSACRGLDTPMSEEESLCEAETLLQRKNAEEIEEEAIRARYAGTVLPCGKRVVFDSEGMKVLNG